MPEPEPDPRQLQEIHQQALASARSAALLRRAKAFAWVVASLALLVATGAPLFFDRPTLWFGLLFGPIAAPQAVTGPATGPAPGPASTLPDSLLESVVERLDRVEDRSREAEKRGGRIAFPFAITATRTAAESNEPSPIVVVKVAPTSIGEHGDLTDYETVTFSVFDLWKPQRIFGGLKADCAEVQLEVSCVDDDGVVISRSRLDFERSLGRWKDEPERFMLVSRAGSTEPSMSVTIRRD